MPALPQRVSVVMEEIAENMREGPAGSGGRCWPAGDRTPRPRRRGFRNRDIYRLRMLLVGGGLNFVPHPQAQEPH
jgi:hypothetical protein